MFNKDFYPTPREVIDTMLVGVDVKEKIVLEPSAGKGDIVDVLFEYGASRVMACEINPDLAQIVAQKAQFLKADFLDVTAEEISHVDLIVMNPPFSADEKHITHAFEIMPKGCELVALCNAETINNPFSRYRDKLKYLIDKNGYSSYLGKVFDTAERKSDVGVALVRLFKRKDGSEQDEFEGYFDLDETPEYAEEGIMKHNEIREIVNRYVGAVKLFDEVLDHNVRMNQLIGMFPMSEYTHGGYNNELFKFSLSQKDKPIKREEFKTIVQKAAWKYVFAKMKMEKYMTQGVKQDINKFIEKQVNVPFTMKNIFKMLEIIVGTSSSRFNQALLEVFDEFTKHTKDNRYAVEGWATNSHYMFNRKIIINYVFSRESYKTGDEIGIQYTRNPAYLKFDDLIKVMCSLSGIDWNSIGSFWDYYVKNGQYADRPALKTNTWYDFGFFRFKGFLKSTMHLEFKDEKLWCLLNQRVGELKGFVLPEEMKKKAKQKEKEIKKDKFPGAEPEPMEPEQLMIEAPKKAEISQINDKTNASTMITNTNHTKWVYLNEQDFKSIKPLETFPNERVIRGIWKGKEVTAYFAGEITYTKVVSQEAADWHNVPIGSYLVNAWTGHFPTQLIADVVDKMYNSDTELSRKTGYISKSLNLGTATVCVTNIESTLDILTQNNFIVLGENTPELEMKSREKYYPKPIYNSQPSLDIKSNNSSKVQKISKMNDVFVTATNFEDTGKLLIEVTGNHKPHKEFIKSQGVKAWDGENLRWWTKFGTPAQYEALMAYFGSGEVEYDYELFNRELLNISFT